MLKYIFLAVTKDQGSDAGPLWTKDTFVAQAGMAEFGFTIAAFAKSIKGEAPVTVNSVRRIQARGEAPVTVESVRNQEA